MSWARLVIAVSVVACGDVDRAMAAPAPSPVAKGQDRGEAVFAGGCFWCMETAFEGLPGVKAVISGFTGGKRDNPSYEEVSNGGTGHAESVRVVYDAGVIAYAKLLELYWKNHDPLSAGGQFCDRGDQYRPGIFYYDAYQKQLAEESKKKVEAEKHWKTVTEITQANGFWPAEDYHQDFYKKDPQRYTSYRQGCGRDARLHELWGEGPDVGRHGSVH